MKTIPNPFRTTVASLTSDFTKLTKRLQDVVTNADTDVDTFNTVIDLAIEKRSVAMTERTKAERLIKNINKLLGE